MKAILLACFIPWLAAFADSYYDSPDQGWHWYQEPIESPKDAEQNDPVQHLQMVKQTITRALDTAILKPTPKNVERYIVLQNKMSASAERFSKMWQLVLLQNPKLDYSISHPTNQVGREVYLDQMQIKEESAIHALAARHGLFFFYRSTCPYCARFAPIVKDFSQRYGISVVPITTDHIPLPEFPHSQMDQGQAAQFHVSMEPALFTVNPYTKKAIPVAYGLLSEADLKARMLDIATHFKGDE